MPDVTVRRLPGEVFERNVAASNRRSTTKSKGGIRFPNYRYRSFVVNIRPNHWKKEKFWIGKINNYEEAQFIAEAVYYYTGQPTFHLPHVNFNFPALECTGAAAPLTSREMCSEYAKSIATGPELASQRAEFVERVTKVAREEVKRVEVQRVLQQIRDENGAALMGSPIAPHEEEDVQADQPMEAEHPNHLPLLLASLDAVHQSADGVEAYVPGFDVSVSGVRLHSGLTLTDSVWADSCLCVPEDHVASPHRDGEEFCSVTRVSETETSFDCPSTIENFQANFFAV